MSLWERLARLGRGGRVRRVQRGIYCLPSPGEGPDPVAEDPWILADVLFRPCYVGGWTAVAVERIEALRATDRPFRPRHRVEFTASWPGGSPGTPTEGNRP